MERPHHFPRWRDANRLLLTIAQAVRDFDARRPESACYAQTSITKTRFAPIGPRYHKCALGTEMRRQAMMICRLVSRAVSRGDDQLQRVVHLLEAVDDLRLRNQLREALLAFHGLAAGCVRPDCCICSSLRKAICPTA